MSGPWDDFKAQESFAPAPTAKGPWVDFARQHVPAGPQEKPGLWESFGRGAAEGATFGFDDKLGMSKEAREASKAANPWTHFAGEIAGGFVPMVAATLIPSGAGQVAAAGRGAQLATRGAQLVRSALVPGEINSVGQAALQGSKLGAVYGGLSGAGHADVKEADSTAEGLKKRAFGAGLGSAAGAALGAPLGVLGHGAYKVGQTLGGLATTAAEETAGAGRGALKTMTNRLERDRISPAELINQIKSELPATRPGVAPDDVEAIVSRAMQGQSATDISNALAESGRPQPPQVVQELLDEWAAKHLGPLNIVDRASMVRPGAGDNTQMTMRAAAATPGEHVGIARENLLERQMDARGRLGGLFDRMIGSGDYEGVAAKHSTDLESAGRRAYAQAYANEAPFDLSPVLQQWMGKYGQMRGPIPDQVNSIIRGMMTREQLPNGQTVLRPPKDLESFIMARQGLFDAMQSAKREGKGNLSSRLNELYTQMTDEVGKSNPLWLEANRIWRDGKAAEEALEAGAKLTTRLSPNNRESLKTYTDAETAARQAFADFNSAQTSYKAAATPADQSKYLAQMQTSQAKYDAANSVANLYRVGFVRSLNDRLANAGNTHDLTKDLSTKGARDIVGKILGKDAPAFFKAVDAEKAMHRTYSSQFGSQTTPLKEFVNELNWAPAFEASWKSMGLGHGMKLAQEAMARTVNAGRNKDLMSMYMETDPIRQMMLLKDAQALTSSRTTGGNMLGKPVVGAIAPFAGALESGIGQPIKPYKP